MTTYSRLPRPHLVICAALMGALATPAGGQEPEPAPVQLVRMYQLTELTVDGGGQTRAYAINDRGQIVGWGEVGERHHSAHWHNQVTTDLHGTVHFELMHPLFDQDYAEAYDISNGGQIVGTARTMVRCVLEEILCSHAFVLRPAVLTDLATPYPGDALANLWTFGSPCLGAYDSAATGVSNAGHVVGWADREDGVINAFLVVPVNGDFFQDDDLDGVNDLMQNLGTLAANADPVSSSTAVNDAGQVTGYAYTTTAAGLAGYHAFLVTPLDVDADGQLDWYSGANGVNDLMVDLGTLAGGTNSWGRDINNDGDVVGEADYVNSDGERYSRPFFWNGTTMTDLGTLRDNPDTGAGAGSAINDGGVIVGWAEDDNRVRRAFIYEDGQMQDLNDLLYLIDSDGNTIVPNVTLSEARDINADGIIVGWGTLRGSNGESTRGFALNPIMVDPSTLVQEDEEDDPGEGLPGSGEDDYTGDAIPGTPGNLVSGTTDQSTSEPAAPLAGFCTVASLSYLPLTLVGLVWLRFAVRRTR